MIGKRVLTAAVFLVISVMLANPVRSAQKDASVVFADDPIPGHYIVLLEDGVARSRDASTSELPSVVQVVSELARDSGVAPEKVFRATAQGFAAPMTLGQARALASDPRVALVEEDARVEPVAAQVSPPSWGLDRVDQHPLDLDGLFQYGPDGAGVHVFVLDSGIRSTHVDFGGRVDTLNAYSAVQDGWGTEDCFGHGTMTASLIAGSSHGTAKGATLHPVRVLGCDGSGSVSDVVAAIDWITAVHDDHQKGKPSSRWSSVVNVSLAFGGAPSSLNQAVYASLDAGVVYTAAAGNSDTDTCGNLQPLLGLPRVTVVGASNDTDSRASFSSYGSCLDLFAPGTQVQAAFIRSDTDTVTSSGTSMSTAYVSGVAALYLSRHPDASPEQVERVLTAYATHDPLSDVPAGTPNRLLYSFFQGDGIDEAPVPSFEATCRSQQRDCEFDASASFDDGEIVSYAWDFGDGDSTTRKNSGMRHKYDAPGTYTVTLTVTDGAGQASSLERVVEIP